MYKSTSGKERNSYSSQCQPPTQELSAVRVYAQRSYNSAVIQAGWDSGVQPLPLSPRLSAAFLRWLPSRADCLGVEVARPPANPDFQNPFSSRSELPVLSEGPRSFLISDSCSA